MAPTVLFVPGLWEGPTVFEKVVSLLKTSEVSAEVATLRSTGTTSPGNPGMKDDIAAIRVHINTMLARGEDVLLVLHSAGGFLGSEAMQGLDKRTRGEKPGVVGIVFLAAAVFPEGYQHQPLPFAVVEVRVLRIQKLTRNHANVTMIIIGRSVLLCATGDLATWRSAR